MSRQSQLGRNRSAPRDLPRDAPASRSQDKHGPKSSFRSKRNIDFDPK
jgi:hypothetical protein